MNEISFLIPAVISSACKLDYSPPRVLTIRNMSLGLLNLKRDAGIYQLENSGFHLLLSGKDGFESQDLNAV